MPIRGIIFIFLIAMVVCITMKDEIYAKVKKFFENDIDNKGENE